MPRNLVYYVIGGQPEYVELLRASMESLYAFEENREVDVLVLCDDNYKPFVTPLCAHFNAHIHITPNNANHIIASMRKTEVFLFENISEYDRVLYLDCDIIIAGSLKPVFESIAKADVLYVVYENTDIKTHTNYYYSRLDDPHDDATLSAFQTKSIYVFNAGQFGFQTSDVMREHFQVICDDKRGYDSALHFYEQGFMNTHFNRKNAISYDIQSFVQLFATTLAEPSRVIYHFSGCGTPASEKLRAMRALQSEIRAAKL